MKKNKNVDKHERECFLLAPLVSREGVVPKQA